jgi:hypothetical protein
MNAPYDRRPSSRTQAQLEAVRGAGAWMPWAGAALALILWGGAAAWLVAALGFETIFKQSPLLLAGGFAAFAAPGLALICAGIMAREGARSAEANSVVLHSARMLLEPAEHSREQIANIAEAVSMETQKLNRALTDTRQRLDGLKSDIESSVTAALKAAEIVRADSEVLVHKMSSERQSLTQLAESLRNQSESLAKSIPRHAQMMSEAARAAQDQVRQADATLDQRLKDLQETAGHLASRIDQLDTMGAESRKRAQNLGGALMRLDEQLVQSTRMVEAATKAGELASAAAKSTAESLRDAVSDALGSAMKATETINTRSAQAADEAHQAMVRLKEAGLQAEATTRTAALAAKAHADETEQRIHRLADSVFRATNKAGHNAEGGLERARQRIEKASHLIHQMKDEPDQGSSSVDDLILEPERPAPAAPADDFFLLEKPVTQYPPLFAREPAPAPPAAKPTAGGSMDVFGRDRMHDDELVLQNVAAPRRLGDGQSVQHDALFGPEPPRNPSWRDLLTGIEEVQPQAREHSAGAMIDRLDRAGVRLDVKASDLRRIATAAHHGERQRRRATRDIAPGEIQRVARLLDTDRDLQHAARNFVTSEEPDALRVLSLADRTREDAAPRLSAYLLLDAALGVAL